MAKMLPACPIETTLMLIGDKWKVLIICDLLSGTKRFTELKKSLGIFSESSHNMLLRLMEEDWLLIRKAYPEIPPRVEYSLTKIGESLSYVINAMAE